MRRLIVPIALVLALATGAWIGQAVEFFTEPTAFAVDTLGGEKTVRTFYDAIQSFLNTGDTTELRNAVAEDFVDQTGRPGTEPTQDGLVRYLGSLRRMYSDLRIVPREILVQHDRVVALVDVTWTQATPFLGISPDGIVPWGHLDLFRVSADRVVAHWGDSSSQSLFEPFVSDVFVVQPGANVAPELVRRSYAPGARDGNFPTSGPAAVLVETGNVTGVIYADISATVVRAVTSTLDQADAVGPIETTDPVVLASGDLLTVDEPALIEIRNEPGEPAEVLVLSLGVRKSAMASGGKFPAKPIGLHMRPLAGEPTADSPTGAFVVSIGRAVLSPGTGLTSHVVRGQELLFVESGAVSVTVGNGMAWTRQPNQTATVIDGAADLQPDTGLSVPDGATVAYWNDGPDAVALFLVTIVPTSDLGP